MSTFLSTKLLKKILNYFFDYNSFSMLTKRRKSIDDHLFC